MIRLLGAEEGLTPDEWREQQYAAHRAEYRALVDAQPVRERKNAALALSLDTERLDVLTFRDKTYDVPTLPYEIGFELSTLWAELTDISRAANERVKEAEAYVKQGKTPPPVYTKEQYADMLAKLKRAVALFWKSVREQDVRRGWWAERVHRVRRAFTLAKRGNVSENPFATASEAEVAELFRFFSDCRMRSSIRRY